MSRSSAILAALALALFGAGAFCILAWGYAWPALLLHAWAWAAWAALLALAGAALAPRRGALALLLAAGLAGPALLLALQAVAHEYWAGPMTLQVVALYAASIAEVSRDLGWPPWALPAGLLAAGAAALGLGWALAPGLQAGLGGLGRRPRLQLGLAVLAFSFAFMLPAQRELPYGHPWRGEPFTLLLQPSVFAPNEAQQALIRRDQQERERLRGAQPAARRTVVLILADALRADRLGFAGYARPTSPFLDSLAADPRNWRPARALAAAPESALSILGLLASREAPQLARGLYKLNEALGDAGWARRFVLSGDHGWMGLKEALGEADSLQDGIRGPFKVSNDDRDALSQVAALDFADPRPLYLHVHLMSTHALGTKDPAYQRWTPSLLNQLSWKDYYDRSPFANRYDNGVLQADAVIAAIHARLKEAGRLDDALFIVTGDHGESLGERGRYGHSFSVDREVMEVPLLIWDSRGRCCRPQAWATHLDIAPTVLRALGLPAPGTWQGRALQDPAPAERWLYTRSISRRPERAIYRLTPQGGQKLRLRPTAPGAGLDAELYDLGADPDERRNLWGRADSGLQQRLLGELQARSGGR